MTGAASADFDAIIVGGGPAGSTCARFLVRGGARVAVVDRAEFPRVKLCAGWLSRADLGRARARAARLPGPALGVEHVPRQLPRRGARHPVPRLVHPPLSSSTTSCCARSGAELHLGVDGAATSTRDADGCWYGRRAARAPPGRRRRHALPGRARARAAAAAAVRSACRSTSSAPIPTPSRARAPGGDGEPELLLHDDLRGYSWNVPKTDWLNVGRGHGRPRRGAGGLAARPRALRRARGTSRRDRAPSSTQR